MRMRLWIIHKKGIGFSKIIAELLQDRLEDYIDVSVGTANKINPKLILEEKFDHLIIGDIISEILPSLEIQNWVLKFGEILKTNNLEVKALSGYYITFADTKVEPLWIEFLQNIIDAEIIYPPIMSLKSKSTDLTLADEAFEKVRVYSNDLIHFLNQNKKKRGVKNSHK